MGSEQEQIDEMREDIVQLQILLTHQEQFIESLNEVVRNQQVQIEHLENELTQLRETKTTEGVSFNLENEKPPHY